jgi:AraC-like DNA-binding protein
VPDLTVAAGLANGLLRFAESKGADRAALAARAGLDLALLEDQDNRVPFERYVALMREAKTMTGDPALALHYGAMDDLAEISIVGLIGHASETMTEAMRQLNRFGRLVVEFDGGPDRFVMQPGPEGLWGVDTRGDPNAFPELTESTFARMICGPRRFGVTQLAKAVQVTHPDPGYGGEYERVLGAPVTFNAPRNAMLMDEKWIFHRIQAHPRYVFGIFSERAEALLKSLKDSKTVRGRVEGQLMPILHTGEPRMEAVAEKLGLSRQTLARRLKAEGVTFENVLDDLRHRLALDYLQGRKVSVNETAYLVGFSEPAAFSRAFKRWTGVSPSTVRAAGA